MTQHAKGMGIRRRRLTIEATIPLTLALTNGCDIVSYLLSTLSQPWNPEAPPALGDH